MQNKNHKKLKIPKLGRGPMRLFYITAPLVLLQVLYLIHFIITKDPYELAAASDLTYSILESSAMSLLLSVGGVLFYDIVEKREKA